MNGPDLDAEPAALVRTLVGSAVRALPHMRVPGVSEFVQTVRPSSGEPSGLRRQGTNLRYTAIVGLGIACLDEAGQRDLLAGSTAQELVRTAGARAVHASDLGAVSLAAWAAAEVCGVAEAALLDRLAREVRAARPRSTVEHAWALTALVAAMELGDDLRAVAEQAAEILLGGQEPSGLFPHALPREALGRFRSHIGCFADQVYPVQALARYAAATEDRRALDAADRCAARIVECQGPAGQWWWHYDIRTGRVVEPYPVYSVHQHGMAPSALFDLHEAGGADHLPAVVAGLWWLCRHPETDGDLLDEATGAIWRKVGRREPRKLVRSVRAVTTSVSARCTVGVLDRVCPAVVIDRECRPYELGWLLYAWRPAGAAPRLDVEWPGRRTTPAPAVPEEA